MAAFWVEMGVAIMKFHHQRKQVSTCIILVLKEVKFLAVFVNKINNLATQSWKKILAFAS
jgi:ACR3 family arsenite efflux pump ArsB